MGVPGRVRARPRVNTVVMPHYIVPCSAAASLCKYALRRWLSLSACMSASRSRAVKNANGRVLRRRASCCRDLPSELRQARAYFSL